MPMTKAEKARMAELEKQLLLARALRFTDPVEPDVPIPATFGKERLAKGFLFNAYTPRVVPACSSSVFHAFGRNDQTDSQGARRLFSTRLRALRALRHAVEMECAQKLAGIDLQIEQELAGEGEENGGG